MKALSGLEERVEKQHSKNKLFYLERLDLLFDSASYESLVSHEEEDGCVVCLGKICEKEVVVACQDFTTQGGSLSLKQGKNIVKAQNIAREKRIPIIYLNDSGGARIQDGVDSLCGYGDIFFNNVKLSGLVPQISIIVGPCAGGAVYSPGITDFVFMVDGISQMYITGPKVIKSVTGESITTEELGGSRVHTEESGVCSSSFQSEQDCFEFVRKLISYIPVNNESYVWKSSKTDSKDIAFRLPESNKRVYDVKDLLNEVFDEGSLLEIFPRFAKSIVTAFAKLDGNTVGIIANQPSYFAGVLDCDSSDKAARFVRFCDCLNIPLVTFTDTPGYLPGSSQETKGIIRHGAKLIYAFSEATTAKINVILRKAFGGAYIAMNSKHLGADYVFALDTAECAVMGAEAAVEVIYAKQLKQLSGEERDSLFEEKVSEYQKQVIGYKEALKKKYIDELVELNDLRGALSSRLSSLVLKKEKPLAGKKHGNIPL